MSTTPCLIYFAEDVCHALGISRSTLKRLRRHRAFPIPELPALDKRPRWSRADVERFVADGSSVHARTVRQPWGVRKPTLRTHTGGVR